MQTKPNLLPSNIIIGTLGPEYSFHDIVRRKNLINNPFYLLDDFTTLFNSLEAGDIQAGLVATYNTIHGFVGLNSELIKRFDLDLVAEYKLEINLHLAAGSQISIDDIHYVYAHPVAWNQCSNFFKSKNIKWLESFSNAQALKDLQKGQLINSAAISGSDAIQHYGLNTIVKNIQNEVENITTFALVKNKYV